MKSDPIADVMRFVFGDKMVGVNKITLCEAQMMHIVQNWLDETTKFNAEVTSIARETGGSSNSNSFVIGLKPKEKRDDEVSS